MPRTLIVFGLGLIAAWVLLKLAELVVSVAIWAGLSLVAIGVLWRLLQRRPRRA